MATRIEDMQLPGVQYTPGIFQGSVYKPSDRINQSLAQAMAMQEARQMQAIEKQTAVDEALGTIELSLEHTPEMDNWWATYKDKIKNDINEAASLGDYGTAIRIATRAAGKVKEDTEVLGRVKASADYKAKKEEVHKMAQAGRISSDTEDWWLSNNQFKYEDTKDANGNIIGGTSYETLETPVADINIVDFTHKAFQLITAYKNNYQGVEAVISKDSEGNDVSSNIVTGGSIERITYDEIAKNLNFILDNTPGARTAMKQDYEVRKHKLNKLLNDENADAGEINVVRATIERNGSPMSFETYCTEMLYNNAVAENLAYENRTSTTTKPSTLRGNQNSRGNGNDNSSGSDSSSTLTAEGDNFQFGNNGNPQERINTAVDDIQIMCSRKRKRK